MLWIVFLALFVPSTIGEDRFIEITNKCKFTIWMQTQANSDQKALENNKVMRIDSGKQYKYKIGADGWGGRFWPKTECDESGNKCKFGQSIPPCPSDGCQPPADTKVEFFFPKSGETKPSFYDISLVDGYSLGATIEPNKDVRPFNVFQFI